jgi:hypothetical protein
MIINLQLSLISLHKHVKKTGANVFRQFPAFIVLDKWNMFIMAANRWSKIVLFITPCDYINFPQVAVTMDDTLFWVVMSIKTECHGDMLRHETKTQLCVSDGGKT